jgi:uncharacterized RDD family membrane protein YckC
LSPDVSLAAPSLRRRMAAWLYEAFLLFAIALVASLVFSVAVDMRSGMDPRRWLLQGFLTVVFAIYFSYLWSRGQTLAMKTWRIRIVDRNGRPLTQGRALLRYLFCSIWFSVPLAAYTSGRYSLPQVGGIAAGWVGVWCLLSLLHPQRQFWHDAWAGTRLVDAPKA